MFYYLKSISTKCGSLCQKPVSWIAALNDESKLCISDTDEESYRPSKRTRADFRPAGTPGSDTDGMASSPGRSQRGNSRDDIPMTDQTDDDPYDV